MHGRGTVFPSTPRAASSPARASARPTLAPGRETPPVARVLPGGRPYGARVNPKSIFLCARPDPWNGRQPGRPALTATADDAERLRAPGAAARAVHCAQSGTAARSHWSFTAEVGRPLASNRDRAGDGATLVLAGRFEGTEAVLDIIMSSTGARARYGRGGTGALVEGDRLR